LLLRLSALGKMVMSALFLYLCSQMFHAPKDLQKVAKTTFQKVLVRIIISFISVLSLGAIMIIWVGV